MGVERTGYRKRKGEKGRGGRGREGVVREEKIYARGKGEEGKWSPHISELCVATVLQYIILTKHYIRPSYKVFFSFFTSLQQFPLTSNSSNVD